MNNYSLHVPRQIRRLYKTLTADFNRLYRSPRSLARRWDPTDSGALEAEIRAHWPPEVKNMIKILDRDRKMPIAKSDRPGIDRIRRQAARLSRLFERLKKHWIKQAQALEKEYEFARQWFQRAASGAGRRGRITQAQVARDYGVSRTYMRNLYEREWKLKPETMLKYLRRAEANESRLVGVPAMRERVQSLVDDQRQLQQKIAASVADNRNRAGYMFGAAKGTVSRHAGEGWHQKVDTLVLWVSRLQLR